MDYEKKITEQIEQYANVDDMHSELPSMHEYWNQKYRHPYFYQLTGADSHIEFYAKTFVESINNTGIKNVVSLGSGEGNLEIEIAKEIKKLNCLDFTFDLVELSPYQNERAIANIKAAGLEKEFNIIEQDFNKWEGEYTYAGVMVHHALHHVQELEHLFEAIKKCLHASGAFVTMDMIGRNGHMLWPEGLEIVERIWRFLPEEQKHHHLLKTTYDEFYNHDCSNEGFEGIRAQDILPLLVKHFNFEIFHAYGGVVDVFIDRGYGTNYDVGNPRDLAFVDFLEYINSLLLELGHIKPTQMAAVMRVGEVKYNKFHRNLSPEFCIRKP